MKRLLIWLWLLLWPLAAQAAEQPSPADAELVSTLLPGYTLVDGFAYEEGSILRLLMRRPDGILVFAGGIYDAQDGWQMTESTPLPDGTVLGYSNFVDSLVIGTSRYLVDVTPFADGSWGVTLLDPPDTGMFVLGPNWIEGELQIPGLVGDHPWSDITRINWNALPASYQEAVQQLDSSNWGRVDSADGSLSLHTQPDPASASLGQYYAGVPVRILEHTAEWTKVDILGLQGWMATNGLAVGDEMYRAEYHGPWLSLTDSRAMMYDQPIEDAPCRMIQDSDFYVFGHYNEEWYHVWYSFDGTTGYFRADDLWEGNG